VTAEGAAKVSVGSDYEVQFKAVSGYALPQTVEVRIGDKVLASDAFQYDAAAGKLFISGSQITDESLITIKVAGEAQGEVVFEPQVVGDTENVTVEANGKTMSIKQTALGKMVSKKAVAGKNISYLVFPESEEAGKMTLTLKVNSFAGGKDTGIFAGAFQTAGDYLYNAVAFRGSGDGNAVSAYWIKKNSSDASKDGSAGNGSPKSEWTQGSIYNVTVEKKSGLYTISWALLDANGTPGKAQSKTFTEAEAYLSGNETARFGIAVTGVDAEITNWKLYDTTDNVLYAQ